MEMTLTGLIQFLMSTINNNSAVQKHETIVSGLLPFMVWNSSIKRRRFTNELKELRALSLLSLAWLIFTDNITYDEFPRQTIFLLDDEEQK